MSDDVHERERIRKRQRRRIEYVIAALIVGLLLLLLYPAFRFYLSIDIPY